MIIPHANLGQIGVVGDQDGQALPINAWTNSMNVRFAQFGVEKIKEPVLRVDTPVSMEIFTTKLYQQKSYVFCASSEGLWTFIPEFVLDQPGLTGRWVFKEIERGNSMWNFTHWGDTVIFNCYEQIPQMWDWHEEDWVDLPKWGIISTEWDLTNLGDPSFDTELRCHRLLAYKSQLVAIGIKHKDPIDAELNPEEMPEESPVYEKTEYLEKDNVVWVSNVTSDPTYKVPEGEPGGGADAGITGLTAGGPPSWDYISPATLSVQQVVGAGDGRYIAAEPLGEVIVIYTIAAAHALIFTGGQYVVQTQRLFQRGCSGEFALCEFDDNHFVIGPDQMYIHDGVTATRVGQDMFDMEFYKRAINLETATISHDPPNKELWIYFDTNYGRKGAIYNYATGTFGWHDGEAKKNSPISYASRGYMPKTGATWGDMRESWKATEGAWISQDIFSFTPYQLALSKEGIYQCQAFYANNKDCWVERISIDFDDAGFNHWINKHVKQYWMQMSGDGVVGVRIGWSNSPLEAPVWEKPVWLDTEGESPYQFDIRTTGRVLSMRFELAEMFYFRWPSGTLNMEAVGAR
jgi:hypothetical protein